MSRSSVVHADDYESSVAGIEIHSTRAGAGSGENSVLVVREDRFTSTSCQIGFPILSWTTIPDDQVLLACITSSIGPGSRWCEIDLEPGAVMLYGPAAEHAATNRPGLAFTFVTATLDQVGVAAEDLGIRLALPGRGRVSSPGTPGEAGVRGAFTALRDGAADGIPPKRLADESLRVLVESLRVEPAPTRVGNARPVSRRRAVSQCIAYAEAIQRVPSIAELCRITHLSERSLRRAFVSEFDLPPIQFFRTWALEEANRRLVDADGSAASETVTSVALGLGFTHLGRFASRYRRLFGESPSVTLRS